MKKTLSINLGGSVFNIDEDAYQLLDKYLNNLRIHFRKEEGSDEIMDDFESRISELFGERVRLGYQVITIQQVEEVIARMGKPEEIFDEENESGSTSKEADEENHPRGEHKRFMRDPDDKILGGVAGGIAAYMGWDVTAVRIAMLLLLLFYGIMIPLYLVFWLVTPLAKTATEKLEMRGESVTVENIGKTVTDGFGKFGTRINEMASSESSRTFLQKAADIFVQVVGFILKFALILLGIVFFPVLAVLLVVMVISAIAILIGGADFLYHFSPFGLNFVYGASTAWIIIGCISMIFFIGIPVFYTGYILCNSFFKTKPLSSSAKWAILVLWILSIVLVSVYFYQTGMDAGRLSPWARSSFMLSGC
ncbi:MAG TPA: PspC family transcriptional regulator [Parabacteroides sp.]|nr:PspC family transcriptional regulator [Parabacteroides sp.]